MLLDITAGVLHLGNTTFEGSQDQAKVRDSSRQSLQNACKFLGLPLEGAQGLERGLVTIRTPQYIRNLGVADSCAQRDIVAKTVYARAFDWLIGRLNEGLMQWKGARRVTIGMLDIFGFEDMPCNGLEQMLINLTNEKIQLLFNTIMFERELEAYKKDGVHLGFDPGPSNLPCITLFTGSPGVVRILADQCKAPGKESEKDKAFVSALKVFKDHPHFTAAQPSTMGPALELKQKKWGVRLDFKHSECFSVRHYAGEVLYTARDFITKSKDVLPTHLADVLAESSRPEVRALFSSEKRDTGRTPEPSARAGCGALPSLCIMASSGARAWSLASEGGEAVGRSPWFQTSGLRASEHQALWQTPLCLRSSFTHRSQRARWKVVGSWRPLAMAGMLWVSSVDEGNA